MSKHLLAAWVILTLATIASAAEPRRGKAPKEDPRLSGGFSTTPVIDRRAYQQISPVATKQHVTDFEGAREIFLTTGRFLTTEPLAPLQRKPGRPGMNGMSNTAPPPPMGPLYNAPDCGNCHVGHGRGSMSIGYYNTKKGVPIQLSVPGTDEHGGPKPHPIYGSQVQIGNTAGKPEIADMVVAYKKIPGAYPDGGRFEMVSANYFIRDPQHGPLGDDTMYSPRFAPPVFGMGLLEAVPDDVILTLADEEDRDGDGISGKANKAWDYVNRRQALGRFGWKAQHPKLRQQIASSARLDHSLTTRSIFPEDDMTEHQRKLLGYAARDPDEFPESELDRLEFYMQSVAVPVRRGIKDKGVLRGEEMFQQVGCAKCHVSKLVTGPHELEYLANQTIYPYTDLLLHDMGSELADNRPVFKADGQEWRTAPLWGIGLAEGVGERVLYLHDGRARTLEEAILWHGGEAEKSREEFKTLEKADREALLRFLKSL